MSAHFVILGLIHLVQGLASLAGAALIALATLGLGGLAAGQDLFGGLFVGTLGLVIAAGVLIYALPELLCGWWMLQRRAGGRILGVILGVLYLPGFPVWTAIGVWSLWALLSEQGAQEYKAGLR